MYFLYRNLRAVCIGTASAGSRNRGPARRHASIWALSSDSDQSGVVRDVKVDKELNVYLQLYPAHKDKELVVKISNERFSSYREWVHGGLELVSPANAGKTPYGWTDWVQSKARYIEYWMDGEIFLHLKRTDL